MRAFSHKGGNVGKRRKYNPRRSNGHRRDKQLAYWRSKGLPCAICGKPIDYSLGYVVNPATGKRSPHPMSFTIDEIKPVKYWYLFGYASPEQCALDIDNQQPAHRSCNISKSAKLPSEIKLAKIIESGKKTALSQKIKNSRNWA